MARHYKTRGRNHEEEQLRQTLIRHLPAWLLLTAIVLMILPNLLFGAADLAGGMVRAVPHALNAIVTPLHTVVSNAFTSITAPPAPVAAATGPVTARRPADPNSIAPLFTATVDHWSGHIVEWAQTYDLDPNLVATVMQIESCGHPTVASHAGAQGLMQVMPYHFGSTENPLDPQTNGTRGAEILRDCIGWADGDPARAMACYNGGPSILSRPFNSWPSEPQRYYRWGSGIYNDALANSASSGTLDQWLAAGGASLCDRAEGAIGLS